MKRNSFTLLLVSLVMGITACRGTEFREPPVHLNPNMDNQDKYNPYRASTFFKDKRTMRTPPAGTYPTGKLREKSLDYLVTAGNRKVDSAKTYHTGKLGGQYMENVPFALNYSDLERGKDRYAIYCTPCHGPAGFGDGTVASRARGKLLPSNFHAQPAECQPAEALAAERANIVMVGEQQLAQAAAEVPTTPEDGAPVDATAEADLPNVDVMVEVVPSEPTVPAWQNEATLGAEVLARLSEIDVLLADPYGGCSEGSMCVSNQTELASDKRMMEGQCQRTLGYIYHVITNGIRSMKPYRHQLDDPADRWAVAAYVRALQLSQSADRNRVVDFLSARKLGPASASSVLKALESGKPHTFTTNQSFVPSNGAKK
jgi:mono/diheme cytochrome c family protein